MRAEATIRSKTCRKLLRVLAILPQKAALAMPRMPWLALLGAALTLALTLALPGCWTAPLSQVRARATPQPVVIPGLSPCDQPRGGTVVLDPTRPLTLLVHGCNFSLGGFRTLASVFQAHGQQTICFNYNDRDRLEDASAQLIRALQALETQMEPTDITIVGHSQGGLVARRALVAERQDRLQSQSGFRYQLVTISSPFGGIRASRHCGLVWLRALSLGTTMAICQAVAGSKWWEIFPGADFMDEPGTLSPAVARYLKVVTDERDTCRHHRPDGSCAERDEVFALAEQYNRSVDRDPRVMGVEVRAGHVEIVGELGTVPAKLIQILQDRHILAQTPPGRQVELTALLRRLYHAR
jgi:pimeloyl-ACP methyl ester carboxylesterase